MNGIENINLTGLKKCDQIWEDMTPGEQGRICQKCAHQIIDFRSLNQKEIAEIHTFTEGKVCGLYHSRQLKLAVPPQRNKKTSRLKAFYLLMMGFILSTDTQAQEVVPSPKTEQVEQDSMKVSSEADEELLEKDSTADSLIISGILTEEAGSPLVYANVHIEGTATGVTTDYEGNYRLDVAPSLKDTTQVVLVYSYIGFTTQKMVFERDQLSKESTTTMDVILYSDGMVTEFYVSRRPLHKRIWYGFLSLFR